MTAFNAIVEGAPEDVAELAWAARALIYEVHPDAVEVVWPKQGSAGFGLGPRKYSEHYCHIIPHKRHVNLGFNHARSLGDPQGLLSGTGKRIRHVRLDRRDQLDSPHLRSLVRQAVDERRKALGLMDDA